LGWGVGLVGFFFFWFCFFVWFGGGVFVVFFGWFGVGGGGVGWGGGGGGGFAVLWGGFGTSIAILWTSRSVSSKRYYIPVVITEKKKNAGEWRKNFKGRKGRVLPQIEAYILEKGGRGPASAATHSLSNTGRWQKKSQKATSGVNEGRPRGRICLGKGRKKKDRQWLFRVREDPL